MKEIKDYLHLYLGCLCIAQRSFSGLSRYIAKGDRIKLDSRLLLELGEDGSTTLALNFIKPILRPLSSMTEDEAKEIDLSDIQIELLNFGSRLQMFMTADQYKKCLEWNFDLFGFIEAGLAIMQQP